MIDLDQARRDAETMRSTVRSMEGGADRLAAFHRLWQCLPELVDELESRRREADICSRCLTTGEANG